MASRRCSPGLSGSLGGPSDITLAHPCPPHLSSYPLTIKFYCSCYVVGHVGNVVFYYDFRIPYIHPQPTTTLFPTMSNFIPSTLFTDLLSYSFASERRSCNSSPHSVKLTVCTTSTCADASHTLNQLLLLTFVLSQSLKAITLLELDCTSKVLTKGRKSSMQVYVFPMLGAGRDWPRPGRAGESRPAQSAP